MKVVLRSPTRCSSGAVWHDFREHLFPWLESDRILASVCPVAGFLARAEVPLSILSALRLGRMTALRKPSGGVRGLVVSDVALGCAHIIPTIRQESRDSHRPVPVRTQYSGVNHVQQGESGEQGDPFMPMSFTLGQHSALVAI